MNPFIVVHHCPPQDKTKNNSNRSMLLNRYITHPTRAVLWDPQTCTDVSPGQGRNLWVHDTSFCNSDCHNCYKAGNCKCYDKSLNQHFTQKTSNSNYTHEFCSLAPLPPPHAFSGNIGPVPPPLLWLFSLILLLTASTQHTHNDNMSLVYYIHNMADNTLVLQILLLTYWCQWDWMIYNENNRDTKY